LEDFRQIQRNEINNKQTLITKEWPNKIHDIIEKNLKENNKSSGWYNLNEKCKETYIFKIKELFNYN